MEAALVHRGHVDFDDIIDIIKRREIKVESEVYEENRKRNGGIEYELSALLSRELAAAIDREILSEITKYGRESIQQNVVNHIENFFNENTEYEIDDVSPVQDGHTLNVDIRLRPKQSIFSTIITINK